MDNEKNDFSKGSVYGRIMALAVPMTVAQLVQMIYNLVDRIYIGNMPGASSMALTGLGLTFPIVTIVMAFTNLFGTGGAPLFSIARGQHNDARAEKIMGNTFTMLCISAVLLMALSYLFMKPVLYLFGASDASYPYAEDYLRIYLIGTPAIMIVTGMNGFINAQGFGKTGMATLLIGAIANIILDPIFIFVLQMGIAGAAAATVISQLLSVVWVMSFLLGKRTLWRLRKKALELDGSLVREIVSLGTAGFIMQASNSAVQIAANSTLSRFGGDVYVGIMAVLQSVRDVACLPMHGITNAVQPVLGFNYGAREYGRVKKAIRFVTIASAVYMAAAWLLIFLFPEPIARVFSSDPELIRKAAPAMHIFFFGFFMMAFHMAGQATFQGLGKAKPAIFFSLLRKIIVVVPLTLILPHVGGFGVNGVFLAEAVSNFVAGVCCYSTMLFVMKRTLAE